LKYCRPIYSTRKGFKEYGIREETSPLETLEKFKSKEYISKYIAEIETGMAEKSSPGTRKTEGQ
jgi:hypothetical protein